MDALDIDHNGLVQRSVRKKPPKHYKLSINSFSSLKSKEKYESNEFEAGGYKWKLVLFPNGNKNRDVKDHISLYLEMGGEKAIKPRKIVTIDYKLFLLNQLKGKETYMVLEHSNKKKKTYCIYRTIVGGLAGFDRFIRLEDFRDASNGYLLDDACEFGAEVLVSAKTTRKTKGECLFTNLNSTAMFKYVWKVAKFSKFEHYTSSPFTCDNQKYCAWRLVLYSKKYPAAGKDSHYFLFLRLDNPHELPPGSKIRAEYTLRIVDQIHGNHCSFNGNTDAWLYLRSYRGKDNMIKREEIARFSKDGSCIIEVEITIRELSIPMISTRR